MHLLKLPVPVLDGSNREELLKLVDQAIDSKRSRSTNDFSAINEKIQMFIYNAYGLTPAEIQLIEESTK
ncbi:hypothetical protein EB118_17280 [bacterium]|nr:hypothetical protein [bacterium]